jgi:predicted nucleic acid-binding protein
LKVTLHPADDRFLECADVARADYLVTGNKRHFPKSWRQTLIVNARELLEWIAPDLRR